MLSEIFHRLCRRKNNKEEAPNSTKQSYKEVKFMRNGEITYESPYDALEKSIAVSGMSKKEIASILFPNTQKLETAKSRLSRALNPEDKGENLNPDQVIAFMEATRPEDFLYYLCDYFNFTRPVRKSQEDILREVQDGIETTASTLAILIKKVSLLGNNK